MKMKWYYPALGGAMVAIASEIAVTAYELKTCKGLGCSQSVPWYIAVLPLICLCVGTIWTGKEMFTVWRKMMKQPAKSSSPSSS